MQSAKLREWIWARQGLNGSLASASITAVHNAAGWARSVGGINPYLFVFARNGASRERFDREIEALELLELPSARGCTYTVPRQDYPLALRMAQKFGEGGDLSTAVKFLGVTHAEIDHLKRQIMGALGSGDLDPAQLKSELGDAVKNLGPEGKKRGVTTTLPIALGALRREGEIFTKSVSGRLDSQRYVYARYAKNPFASAPIDLESAAVQLADKYFRWTGGASLESFLWFSGLTKTAALAALAELSLQPLCAESDLLAHPEDVAAFGAFEPSREPNVAFLSCLDNVTHLLGKRNLLLDPSDADRPIPTGKSLESAGSLSEHPTHLIVDRGRLVGIWEYDPDESEIVWHAWSPDLSAVRAAAELTQTFVRDQLGDARSFSLDSPASRAPRIQAIRDLAAGQP